MIDGARMLTPGVLQYAVRAARAYRHPVIGTLGFPNTVGAHQQRIAWL